MDSDTDNDRHHVRPAHSEAAQRAWELAKSVPARGLGAASAVLADGELDDVTRAVAIAARGRANFELGNNDLAIADLERAAGLAAAGFRPHIFMALAAAIAARGDSEAAIALLSNITDLDGAGGQPASADEGLRGLALSQLGYLFMHLGDLRKAAATLDRSIGLLQGDEHRDPLARVMLNLGYCTLMLGDFDQALGLFERAIELGRATGQEFLVAGCLQNSAYAHSRLGELSTALGELQQALDLYEASGGLSRAISTVHDDFAETYRLAGLTDDAVTHARLALRHIDGGGNLEQQADATYRLAVCLLDHGDHEQAVQVADRAAAMFRQAERSLWETRAMVVALETAEADLANEDRIDRAERAAEQLDQTGWRTEALRIRNRMALLGLAANDGRLVDRFLLDDVAAGDHSVVGRLEHLLHQAVREHHRDGRADGPLDEARAVLQRHRRRLNDPELRAGSGRLAEAFRSLALDQALSGSDPAAVLAAEEQWRAASLRLPRARPSSDPAVAEIMFELREANRRANEADSPDPALLDRIALLEDRLRRTSHQSSPLSIHDPTAAAEPDDAADIVTRLSEQLGDRCFVQWFGHRGRLYGVGVRHDRAELWQVGPEAEVRSTATRIRRDLMRLLLAPAAGDPTTRWRRVVERAEGLGQHLLAGRRSEAGFVLSPPGALQELPWPVMTPDRGARATISFSASSWLRSGDDITGPAFHMVVGPDLQHGSRDHRRALTNFSSTVVADVGQRADLDRALVDADVLHIAAHGQFRSKSPMFSSIRLGDGDVALHELSTFERVPPLVVLAACDAGRSQHLEQGAELLGTAPAWLSAGVLTVVAPICAVPDDTTAVVFDSFYDALPGATPDQALASAWRNLADDEPRLAATAAAFLCFGSGGPRLGPPREIGR